MHFYSFTDDIGRSSLGSGPTIPADATELDAADFEAAIKAARLATLSRVLPATSVSRAQAKIALSRQPGVKGGKTLLDDVTNAVNTQGGEVAIWFSDATTWSRTSSYVESLGTALGLTDAQIDALFADAAKISA